MTLLVNENLGEPIAHTTIQVIMSMTGILPTATEWVEKKQFNAPADVSSIMTMQSPQTNGSMALSFSSGLLFEMARRMFGEESSEISEEICDLAGELTNMVVGGTKHLLEEKGFDFNNMSTPEIIHGAEQEIHHPFGGQTYSLAFQTQPGPLYLEVNFVPLD